MNRDPDQDTMARSSERTDSAAHPIDDDDVARIVRDIAAGWVMPPVRLDQPGWRDRVRTPRAQRLGGARGWFGRVGQALTGALVLTGAAALVAVYLTGPRTGNGKPGDSSAPATPQPSAAAAATPMPKLKVSGPVPAPAQIVVETGGSEFAVVDLSTGTIGSSLQVSSWGSATRYAPNGDLVCLCTRSSLPSLGNDTREKVSFLRYDHNGIVTFTSVVLDVSGAPDPRDGLVPQQPGHVSAFTTFSADGRFAFVGWSARAHPVWKSGIVVVGLDDGSVVQRLDLPTQSDGSGDSRTYVDAPHVIGQGGGRVVIERSGYDWSPVSAAEPTVTPWTRAFSANITDGTLGAPVELAQGTFCGQYLDLAGGLPDGGLWLSCVRYGSSTIVRRLHPDGSVAGDTTVIGTSIDGSTSAVSPDGAFLYLWNPVGLELTRIELVTGNTSKSKAPAVAADAASDPLTAFGRWLAPAAAAKMLLQSGIALSPDGTRVFALGILGNPNGSEFTGSAGVIVFDAEQMTALGRWPATADYVSIAVSADGASVYAAGMPGFGAGGEHSGQPASITVFNAADGSIALLAGDLGDQMLTFPDTLLK
jgi:hypothetical protein